MYSQMSLAESYSLARSALMRSMCLFYRSRRRAISDTVSPLRSQGFPGRMCRVIGCSDLRSPQSESAESAGVSYDALLQRILNLGRSYRAQWQE